MSTRRILNLRLALTIGIVAVVVTLATCQTYYGTIVDSNSDRPLVGAVVTVVWCKYPWLKMDHGYTFHAAKEAVTDSRGRVRINTLRPIDWNPLTAVFRPQIAVSMVGYQPINDVSAPTLVDDLLHGDTVRLAPLPPSYTLHSCKSATPCANGDGLLDACPLRTANVPLLATTFWAQDGSISKRGAK